MNLILMSGLSFVNIDNKILENWRFILIFVSSG